MEKLHRTTNKTVSHGITYGVQREPYHTLIEEKLNVLVMRQQLK